jgi:hypothetical protein
MVRGRGRAGRVSKSCCQKVMYLSPAGIRKSGELGPGDMALRYECERDGEEGENCADKETDASIQRRRTGPGETLIIAAVVFGLRTPATATATTKARRIRRRIVAPCSRGIVACRLVAVNVSRQRVKCRAHFNLQLQDNK